MSVDRRFLADARDSTTFLKRVERLYPAETPEFQRVAHAAAYTEALFRGVSRKDGTQYHTHCFSVALIGIELLGITSVDTIIAAIIHDNREFVEEETTKGHFEDGFQYWMKSSDFIETNYGRRVKDLSDALTAPYKYEGRSSAVSHAWYHKQLRLLQEDRELFLIKLSDRLHNLWTLIESMGGVSIWKKALETEKFYMHFAHKHNILVQELEEALRDVYALSRRLMP